MKRAAVYFDFIQDVKSRESSQRTPALSPIEQRLLEIVAIINTRHERLSVKDLMSHSEIGSPATIHQYIHAMVDKGWIRLTTTEDARRKQVALSGTAMKYFDKLGTAITKAIAQKNTY